MKTSPGKEQGNQKVFDVQSLLRNTVLLAMIINLIAMVIFACGVASGALDILIAKQPTALQDFIKYYACGKIALSKDKGQAYSPTVQKNCLLSVMRDLGVKNMPRQYYFPTDYPPPVYTLMAPLALLPVKSALCLWWIVSAISAAAGLQRLLDYKRKQALLVIVWTAASFAAWRATAMGQTSWIISGAMAFYFYSLLNKRDTACGIVLAISMLKIQYAPYLLIPALVSKRWKSLAITMLSIVVTSILTVAVLGEEAILAYPGALARVEASDPYLGSMVCLKSLCSWLISEPTLSLVALCGMLIGLGLSLFVWQRAISAGEQAQKWAIAITICLALLTSPHTQNYDLVMLAIPAAVTGLFEDLKKDQSENIWTRAWYCSLFSFPIISWFVARLPVRSYFAQSAAFTGILILLSVLSMIILKNLSRDSGQKSSEALTESSPTSNTELI